MKSMEPGVQRSARVEYKLRLLLSGLLAICSIVLCPRLVAQDKPDWRAWLPHPLEEMRADPHWRVYAAVITHDRQTLKSLLASGDSANGYGTFRGFPLVTACQLGDLESVSALVAAGADVNLMYRGNVSSLSYAAEFGNLDVARFLLAHGANPNLQDPTFGAVALWRAMNHRNFEIMTLLIENGADVNLPNLKGFTLLSQAALNDDFDMVRFLLAHGARFRSPNDELLYAASYGDADLIQKGIADGADVNHVFDRGVTPLMAAALNGQTLAVKKLIAAGANINALDEIHDTPLKFALKSGHKSTILALLDAHADAAIDDVAHDTTLHQAAIYDDDPEIVHRLLDAGVRPDTTNTINVTPLMEASIFGHVQTVKILLDLHVPINVQSREGLTALGEAGIGGNPEVITLLLHAGADPSIRDGKGKSPLDHAVEIGHEDAAAILRNAASAPSAPGQTVRP
jgi:uncharacterized protein